MHTSHSVACALVSLNFIAMYGEYDAAWSSRLQPPWSRDTYSEGRVGGVSASRLVSFRNHLLLILLVCILEDGRGHVELPAIIILLPILLTGSCAPQCDQCDQCEVTCPPFLTEGSAIRRLSSKESVSPGTPVSRRDAPAHSPVRRLVLDQGKKPCHTHKTPPTSTRGRPMLMYQYI